MFFWGLGSLAELLGDPEEASTAYQHALRANPRSMSSILRAANQWAKAIEYLQSVLKLDGNNGEVWGSLGKFIFTFQVLAPLISYRPLLSDGG